MRSLAQKFLLPLLATQQLGVIMCFTSLKCSLLQFPNWETPISQTHDRMRMAGSLRNWWWSSLQHALTCSMLMLQAGGP